MAPEIVSDYISELEPSLTVLDPMMGSGTFVTAAANAGHHAIGFDSDPLAIVLAQTAAWSGDADELEECAERMVAQTSTRPVASLVSDPETREFINFWFDEFTQTRLADLASRIEAADVGLQAPLWCAFSRLIITKDAGASKARDVSHSRPHVVRSEASFDPRDRFCQSVKEVLRRRTIDVSEAPGTISLGRGDARNLPLASASIDAIMTSPPYLTAIDYLRGHRLSLVWMGHTISDLRELRGGNIGSEKGADLTSSLDSVRKKAVAGDLPIRRLKVVNRYLRDLDDLLAEMARVLAPGGHATFVVANSTHSGTAVNVDDAISLLAKRHGLNEQTRVYRQLPESSRYLPPPSDAKGALDRRMRSETILTLRSASRPPQPRPHILGLAAKYNVPVTD